MTGREKTRRPRSFVAAIAALTLAVVTGACYTYSGGTYGGPDAPLRVRLASTFQASAYQPSLHFAVSDRAHVAVFQVFSSGHVRALYPYRPEAVSRFGPGAHSVFSPTTSYGNSWRYTAGSFLRYGSAYRYGSTFGVGHMQMTYTMIVAAREPLRMDRIRNDVPFRYRSVSALASPLQRGSSFGTMDLLLDRLIPPALPQDDWDVDWTVSTVRAPIRRFVPLRRIAAQSQPGPVADDSAAVDETPEVLDPEGIAFNPPRVPVDLPEVRVEGGDGASSNLADPPPIDIHPTPRPTPGGGESAPAVDGSDVEEPTVADEDAPDRANDGPRSAPGPSKHFRRLFGDDRDGAESWSRVRDRNRERRMERRKREWIRQLVQWTRNPEERSFPDPPEPPAARWNDRGATGETAAEARTGESAAGASGAARATAPGGVRRTSTGPGRRGAVTSRSESPDGTTAEAAASGPRTAPTTTGAETGSR